MIIHCDSVLFVMIDVQERFAPHIKDINDVVKKINLIHKALDILELPLLVTEQYPEGLGRTISEIKLPLKYDLIAKTRFSIFDGRIMEFIKQTGKDTIIIYGIEAHVCVTQSVMEGLSLGYKMVVVDDAVSAISPYSKEIAFPRIREAGATIVTTEMLLFELIKDAVHPDFKAISKLVKEN